MCDQTEVHYKEGDIVWVKLGSYFWPGEVQDVDKLDEEILVSFKKKPLAAVKFFDEDKYEYVKNLNQICLYNCRKKHDFIKKGLDMYRKQKDGSYMDKFPGDVRKAEMRTGGNMNILSEPEFQPQEKPNYQGLFGSEKKGRHSSSKPVSPAWTNGRKSQPPTPVRNPPTLVTITHPRFIKGDTDHKVHIRHQPVSPSETAKAAATTTSSTAAYRCQLCDFTSNRLNVIVLHNKFHSANTSSNETKGKNLPAKSKTSSPKPRAATARGETKGKIKPKGKSPSKEPKPLTKPGSPIATTPKASSPPKVSAVKRKILEESKKDIQDTDAKEKQAVIPESPEKKRTKVASPESQEKNKQKAIALVSPEKKIPKSPVKMQDAIKSPVSGKRKSTRGGEKAAKKVKNDEEIREKLLADWDDEDAEQEEKEMELLKQKLVKGDNGTAHSIDVAKSDEPKAASCFDFDDSKDAILDSKLEERAKKFVENRKVPRVIDDKTDKLTSMHVLETSPSIDSQQKHETEDTKGLEDFDKAINTLLEETAVPKLPEVPLTSSESSKSSLPDVVLGSSQSKTEEVQETTSAEFQGRDHDYSAKQNDDAALLSMSIGDDDILDINSMPVVMADAIITEEPSTSNVPVVNIQMSKIDLIPNPNSVNTHTVVMSDGRLAMPPSVQSVVKAVRGSTADRSKPGVKTVVSLSQLGGSLTKVSNKAGSNISRLQSTETLTPARGARLLQQGIASGKYVIVQPTATTQPRLTHKTNTPQQVASIKPVAGTSQQQINLQSAGSGKLVYITKGQSGSQQQVLTALTPAQQKALVAGGKLPPPQRLLTSTGQLLTPVNPRNVMPKGTKLTPVTGQQMRTIAASGKQTLGPKIQMQSLQTKIILPTMETVKMPQTQPQSVVRMVTTGKPQSNTILIQATQGSSMLSSIVSKVSTSAPQSSPRVTVQTKQQRPRQLTSATMLQQAAGKPILPSIPKVQQPTTNVPQTTTRQMFQPRMLVQKSRPAMLANVRSVIQPVVQGPKITPRSQVFNQVTLAQAPKQLSRVTTQSVQKPTQTRPLVLGSKSKLATTRQPVHNFISSPSLPRTNTVELLTTQALPPLAPMQLATTSSHEMITLAQAPSISLPSFQSSGSEQLVPTSSTTLGASAPPTYMLLTIDEAGNLQPYNSQSLISYDGSDQSGQTIYIDGLESGGDLDNIILTIGNSSSLALDMGQTNTMTSVSSIYNTRAPSSSQDILAAALANTDVFQSEHTLHDTMTVVSSNRSSVMTPCVVESSVMLTSPPPSLLLPSMNRAADVSETSLTLNQPIMTPLEVPSSVIPTRAQVPISFPMGLPLTVTQSLSSPMSSYTVLNENVPTSETMFQPSMPLLSEEMSDIRTTTSSDLSHSDITYDAIQVHSELPQYANGQSQLVAQTSDNVQCAQQQDSFFNVAPSDEPHCPTSTVFSSQEVSGKTPSINSISEGSIEMSDAKEIDLPTEMYKVSNSLPSVLSSDVSQNCQPQEIGSEDPPIPAVQTQLPQESSSQPESNTTEHSFKNTHQIVDGLDSTNNMPQACSSFDDNVLHGGATNCPQQDNPTARVSAIADEDDHSQVSPTTQPSTTGDGEDGKTQSMSFLSEDPANVKDQLGVDEDLDENKGSQRCTDSHGNEVSFCESDR